MIPLGVQMSIFPLILTRSDDWGVALGFKTARIFGLFMAYPLCEWDTNCPGLGLRRFATFKKSCQGFESRRMGTRGS